MFDRDFTKSLIIRDFDDVLKNPFRYVDLFLLHTLLSKKNSENRHARPVKEGPEYIPKGIHNHREGNSVHPSMCLVQMPLAINLHFGVP